VASGFAISFTSLQGSLCEAQPSSAAVIRNLAAKSRTGMVRLAPPRSKADWTKRELLPLRQPAARYGNLHGISIVSDLSRTFHQFHALGACTGLRFRGSPLSFHQILPAFFRVLPWLSAQVCGELRCSERRAVWLRGQRRIPFGVSCGKRRSYGDVR
jgi:hypothetical protein